MRHGWLKHPAAALLLAVVAVASVALPWWVSWPALDGEREWWTGFEVLGPWRLAVMVIAVFIAAVSMKVLGMRRSGPLVAAAGAVALVAGALILATWGWRVVFAAGWIVAVCSGVIVLAVAGVRSRGVGRRSVGSAVAVALVASVAMLPAFGHPLGTESGRTGPYLILADGDASRYQIRSGMPLRAVDPAEIDLVSGAIAIGTSGDFDGLIASVAEGRVRVVRQPDAGRSFTRWAGASGRWVLAVEYVNTPTLFNLDSGGQITLIVGDHEDVRLGSDGRLWVSDARGKRAVRVGKLSDVLAAGTSRVDLRELKLNPVSSVESLGYERSPEHHEMVASSAGLAVRRFDRLVLVDEDVRTVVFGRGLPGCELSSEPAATVGLSDIRLGVVADRGATWLARSEGVRQTRILLLADGKLRHVPHRVTGKLRGMVLTGDGGLLILTDEALLLLPDAVKATESLPAPAPNCLPDLTRLRTEPLAVIPAPEWALNAVDGLGADRTALSADDETGAVYSVRPDGTRTMLGKIRGKLKGRPVADSGRGAWWLEDLNPKRNERQQHRFQLVHAVPGVGVERARGLTLSALSAFLVPDITGRQPLIGTDKGLVRLTANGPQPIPSDTVDYGVGSTLPRGLMVLRDGRVVGVGSAQPYGVVQLEEDGSWRRLLGARGGADADADAARVDWQLAEGVAVKELRLPWDASLAPAADGSLLLLADGVLVSISKNGRAEIVGYAPRLGSDTLVRTPDGSVLAELAGRYVQIEVG